MRIRTVAIASMSFALASALAAAAPAAAAPEPTGSAGGITMVNGAGKTVTIPASAVAAMASATQAGGVGYTPGGQASARKSQVDSVIGADDRVQESVPGSYPWRAIVHLSMNFGSCTGFMISRDVVVTAGHCVYSGGWATSYTATPGRVGFSAPYGSCSGGINDVWTTWDYMSTGSADYDYGLIKLTCDIGYTVGWWPWWYHTGETLTGQYFYVEGYPGDKPFGTMWYDSDPITGQSATRMWYQIDTFGGQSGSPIFRYNSVTPGLCSGWCVTGIHTTGNVGGHNSGTRFNPNVMAFINYWVNQP